MVKNLFVALIAFFLLMNGQKIYAQSENPLQRCTSLEDSLSYLKSYFLKGDKFISKPVKNVFRSYENLMPIKYLTTLETSPWIDPKGRSYLQGVSLYYYDLAELQLANREGRPVIYVDIYFEDTGITDYDFWQSIPEGDEDAIFENLANYIVKEIKIYIL